MDRKERLVELITESADELEDIAGGLKEGRYSLEDVANRLDDVLSDLGSAVSMAEEGMEE